MIYEQLRNASLIFLLYQKSWSRCLCLVGVVKLIARFRLCTRINSNSNLTCREYIPCPLIKQKVAEGFCESVATTERTARKRALAEVEEQETEIETEIKTKKSRL